MKVFSKAITSRYMKEVKGMEKISKVGSGKNPFL